MIVLYAIHLRGLDAEEEADEPIAWFGKRNAYCACRVSAK